MFAGWYILIACLTAFLLLLKHGPLALTIASGIILVVNFWSWGILHNFQHRPDLAPRSWRGLHATSSILGLLLLVAAIIRALG